MTHRFLSFLGLTFVYLIFQASPAFSYTPFRVSSSSFEDQRAQINERGQVVWLGPNYEVFLCDGATTVEISRTDHDSYPQINDKGQVVWARSDVYGYEDGVFLYDGSSIIQLSNTNRDDRDLKINASGQVVWHGTPTGDNWQIFLYDGFTTRQLTNTNHSAMYPQINDNGQVVWQQYDGYDWEIFLYDGNTIIQLTDNSFNDTYPQINSNGLVVWSGGTSPQIFLYNGIEISQLTNNSYNNSYPKINSKGQVVWTSGGYETYQVWFYDGVTTVRLSNIDGSRPQINDKGQVVWQESDGKDHEIFVYDGAAIIRITSNDYFDSDPQINGRGQIDWNGGDLHNQDIFFATQEGPTVDIKINGSDGPLEAKKNSILSVSLSLDPRDLTGVMSKFYFYLDTPWGFYHLAEDGQLKPGSGYFAEAPLEPFNLELLMEKFPKGDYVFHFDAKLFSSSWVSDSVEVKVKKRIRKPKNTQKRHVMTIQVLSGKDLADTFPSKGGGSSKSCYRSTVICKDLYYYSAQLLARLCKGTLPGNARSVSKPPSTHLLLARSRAGGESGSEDPGGNFRICIHLCDRVAPEKVAQGELLEHSVPHHMVCS